MSDENNIELIGTCKNPDHWSDMLVWGKCHTCNKTIVPLTEKELSDEVNRLSINTN